MPRQIDRGKEKVADFGRGSRSIAVKRVLDLVGLFADLAQHGARIVPIEADLPVALPALTRALKLQAKATQGKAPQDATLAEMDALWDEAKARE